MRSCSTCKYYEPDKSLETLWGWRKKAAEKEARCGMPGLPTTRYSLRTREFVFVWDGEGRHLYVAIVRKLDLLCGADARLWEEAVRPSRLTRAKNLGKRIISWFRRKPVSA